MSLLTSISKVKLRRYRIFSMAKKKQKKAATEVWRILVVDDSHHMRELLADHLKRLGITEIDSAENGRVAYAKLVAAESKKVPFKVLITDWHMPEMDGIELLKLCRANSKLTDLHILMVASEGEGDLILQAIMAGAEGYLPKPFTFDEIKNKFEKLFEIPILKAS